MSKIIIKCLYVMCRLCFVFNIYFKLIPIDYKMPQFPPPPSKVVAKKDGQYDQLMKRRLGIENTNYRLN